MSEFHTKPNPDQADRCPSIDPHDTLQCTRRIHEDDQCQCGGIAWKKGTPRYVSDAERAATLVAKVQALVAKYEALAETESARHVRAKDVVADLFGLDES